MNVWSDITYSNGAVGQGYIWYQANGTLDLTITGDLSESHGELEVTVGTELLYKPTVFLNVDLRDEYDGLLSHSGVGGDSEVIMLQNVGWSYRSPNVYSTSLSDDSPFIRLIIRGDVIYARLHN
ncbi:MAG: hypothetical protein RTU30_07025 [Candidatus Thorarchaeota archaeon]